MKRKLLVVIFALLLVTACTNDDNYNDKHGDKAIIPQYGTTVTMMTYNIYGARATDPSNAADLDALAEVIKRQSPDFVALQEVDKFTNRSGKTVHQARELAEKLDMYWHFTRAIDRDGGEYGDAVLSRFPIESTLDFKLTPDPNLPGEDRSVCVIKVKVGGQELYVASTHLDHLSQDLSRKSQANQLRTIIGDLNADVIVGGDFNALPDSEVMSIVGSYMIFGCKNGCDNTFPTSAPNRTIDYILYSPIENFAVRSYSVVKPVDQKVDGVDASDHLPVLATLKLKIESEEK